MAFVCYHEAEIPRRKYGDKMRLEVETRDATVILGMTRADGTASCHAALTVVEAKKLVEGILDALTGHCGLTFEKRNRFCKALEVHPKRTS